MLLTANLGVIIIIINLLLVGQVTRYLVSLRKVLRRSAVRWSRLLLERRWEITRNPRPAITCRTKGIWLKKTEVQNYDQCDENLLLYAGASLNQLADELHQRGAKNRVLLHIAGSAWCHNVGRLRNHSGDVARLWRFWISCDRVVQLGEQREENLEIGNCFFSGKVFFLEKFSPKPECLRLSWEWNGLNGWQQRQHPGKEKNFNKILFWQCWKLECINCGSGSLKNAKWATTKNTCSMRAWGLWTK